MKNALANSLESPEINDNKKTKFERGIWQRGEFSDATLEMQNRCRLVKIVRGIEKIDVAEASQQLIEESTESVK